MRCGAVSEADHPGRTCGEAHGLRMLSKEPAQKRRRLHAGREPSGRDPDPREEVRIPVHGTHVPKTGAGGGGVVHQTGAEQPGEHVLLDGGEPLGLAESLGRLLAEPAQARETVHRVEAAAGRLPDLVVAELSSQRRALRGGPLVRPGERATQRASGGIERDEAVPDAVEDQGGQPGGLYPLAVDGRRTTSMTAASTSSGSCSTHPGFGWWVR